MKNTFKFLFVTAFSLSILIFSFDGNSQENRMKNGFFLGPINVFYVDSLHSSRLLSWYNLLHYNAMQNYCSVSDSLGYDWEKINQRDGGFFEPLFSYQGYINDSVINKWFNFSNSNSLIFQREKVQRGGYGQRSTYQAEYDQYYWNNKFPKYGYNNYKTVGREKLDDAVFGSNIVSRYCIKDSNTAGYMVKGLIENAEQINYYALITDTDNRSGVRLFSDIKQTHYNYKWHIKPRIRIDSAYAKAHPSVPVAVIITKNYLGDVIKKDTIICNHFLRYNDGIKFYDGRYLEMFYNLNGSGNTPSTFYVKADSLIQGRTAENDWKNSNVDFSIYWCGNVDTYLDYVRIDDDWAHYLFTDINGDYSNYKFHQKIAEEVNAFSYNNGFGYFYIDEIFYNNIPCVAEVNRIIKSLNPNTSMVIMNNIDRMFVEGGLKDELDHSKRKATIDTLFSSGAEKDIYLAFVYPYYYKLFYPPNVSTPDINEVPASAAFNKASTPAQYNEDTYYGIQQSIQGFLNTNKYERLKAKEYNMNLAYSIQVHSDECSIDVGNPNSWGLREPTNEEIRVLCFSGLAMCTKQLLQYSFFSYLSSDRPNYNSWGLVFQDWKNGNGEFKIGGINVSTNGGYNWQYIGPLNKTIYSVTTSGNRIYAGTGTGVQVTTNNGVNWIQTSLNTGRIRSLLSAGNYLFAGTESNGVYFSSNNGTNWTQKNQGWINNMYVSKLIYLNDKIYAGTFGSSVYLRDLAEIVSVKNISSEIPSGYSLGQNYPNPFNPTTKIRIDIPGLLGKEVRNIKLQVYDVMGREVQTLIDEPMKPGTYEIYFDGSPFPSGAYFYTLKADDYLETKKMVLLK